ncbi:rop guanine nucleotide exchange factor 14 isoform X2 [Macadamia integrifolia]|uniref:rop guanine nucleotide exchange factor 14 isoform X2 n=1 Tax=Macadamia integrifolia TaxID=60698 RepID=UPI001C4F6D4D|nr:rop guanine nucleotide exchange factor 14 isoform X2 [Macadamia integrifolia]XP_042491835.1 rop guanine nucleotide exchange factor 14 isoform X2 [Macadamia integrifolia]
MRRLVCCRWHRGLSFDFDEQDRIVTYNGLESRILNSCTYDNESGTSRGDGCPTDSLDEDASSCSSSKDAFGSFSSQCLVNKPNEHGPNEWEDVSSIPQHICAKEKPPVYSIQFSDVEAMKERFAKLLLGEDVTGGRKGLSPALALSNAITNLAASIFGELWKLEPLPEERKSRWRREMDWLLSPTHYMVELVPAKQNGADGGILEIMIPKARPDVHVNLPALQKLDSMLIELLDSMVNTEFWYAEGGSRAEGRSSSERQSRRWWLPSPRVPMTGLSVTGRKKLIYQGKVVEQMFKATKSINENVLLEMPVPTFIKDALPKSGRASLGEELYKILTADLSSVEETFDSLNLESEHAILETVNRLETAVFAWKQKISGHISGKSPVRNSWSFVRDPISELDKIENLMERAEGLLQLLKIKFPNLPQTFLDVTKVQYNKDVGHSILEAYSRVLGSLAFSILCRIKDILQEDLLSNPNSPVTCCFPGINLSGNYDTQIAKDSVRHSLIDQMNRVDGQFRGINGSKVHDAEFSDNEVKPNLLIATPCRSRVWCIGRKACSSLSAPNSP